jgi:HlyD family secretion protein
MNSAAHGSGWTRILWLAAVAAVGAAIYWFTREAPVKVTVVAVDRGTVQATVANTRAGSVSACRRAHLSPLTGGLVSRIDVREGDRVAANQPLLELWNDDLKAQLKLAREELAAAQARREDACVRAAVAARESERQAKLFKNALTTEERRERAQGEAQALAAACRAAESTLGVREAEIQTRSAMLEKTVLRAPFAGVIAELNPELGEFVTPSPPGIPTPPAVDLVDDDCRYVTAPIDEVDAAAIRPGMRASITLDALRDRSFEGRVRRIAPYVLEAQKQARTVDVEVEFARPERARELLVGYSADVEIVLEERGDALRVPSESVREGASVLVLENGRLEERTFQAGLSNWRYTEVRTGLRAGEQVVTSLEREGVSAGRRAIAE